MKIWIDYINTSGYIFVPFIRDFKNDNHEILLTCRDSEIPLICSNSTRCLFVGEKVGKGQSEIVLFPRLVSLFSLS
jgi:hypothetical protein